MRIVFLLFILIATGCARPASDPGAFNTIDPTFNQYYASFSAAENNAQFYMPIALVSQVSPIVGRCVVYDDGHRQIEIDPAFWMGADQDTRTVLVWHELGHCVFNRTHNHSYFVDSGGNYCAFSIMNPYIFGDPCFTNNRVAYEQELPHAEPGDYL